MIDKISILLIVDVKHDISHSAVEGLFGVGNKDKFLCQKVFFDKSVHTPLDLDGRIILPYRYRRRGFWRVLNKKIDPNTFQIIIVRNLFKVLLQVQKARPCSLVGFWESFPHSYRRLEQAIYEKRAIFRKRIEYFMAQRREFRLIQDSDFYLPITQTHKKLFYPNIHTPCMPIPMGFDFKKFPIKDSPEKSGPIRFVFIGSIDKLRNLDIVCRAFLEQNNEKYVFEIYSNSRNRAVDNIRSIHDERIIFHKGLPRDVLFDTIVRADIGVCFFPHTKTYIGASPTKTLEYGALGLSVLVNPMPEYDNLIDDECAYICDFELEAIKEKIGLILHTDRQVIAERAKRLQKKIFEKRNYSDMGQRLYRFFMKHFDLRPKKVDRHF